MGPEMKNVIEEAMRGLQETIKFTLTGFTVEDSSISLKLKLSQEAKSSDLFSVLNESFEKDVPIQGKFLHQKLPTCCSGCGECINSPAKGRISLVIDMDSEKAKCEKCETKEYSIEKPLDEMAPRNNKKNEIALMKDGDNEYVDDDRDEDWVGDDSDCSSSDDDINRKGIQRAQSNKHADAHNCTVCNQSFKSSECLKKHENTCKIKTMQFNSQTGLDEDPKVHKCVCKVCEKSFDSQVSLASHMCSDHDIKKGEYICPYCPKVFKAHIYLKRHMKRNTCKKHGPQKERKFKCPLCPKSYMERKHLNEHLKKTIHIRSKDSGDSEKPTSQKTHVIREYKCPVCGKDHVTQAYLRKHMEDHTEEERKAVKLQSRSSRSQMETEQKMDISCPVEVKTEQIPADEINLAEVEFEVVKSEPVAFNELNVGPIISVRKITKPKEHKCTICDKVFADQTSFRRHSKYNHAVSQAKESFLCHICGEPFSSQTAVDKHVESNCTFSERKRQKCTVCGLWMKNSVTLEKHMQIHTDTVKSFMCELCGKCFTRKNQLQNHSLTHANFRPHQCDICGRKFRNVWHMKMHRKLHTGEDLVQCPKCHDWFVNESYVKGPHLRKYCPALRQCPCQVCGRVFSSKIQLDRHMGYHSGERPYICEKCGQAFASTANLDDHYKRHFAENKFPCPHCERRFPRNSELTKHLKRHYKAESGCLKRSILPKQFKPNIVRQNVVVADNELKQATILVSESAESVVSETCEAELNEQKGEITVTTTDISDLLTSNTLTFQTAQGQVGEEIHVVLPSELVGASTDISISESGEIILVAMDPKSTVAC